MRRNLAGLITFPTQRRFHSLSTVSPSYTWFYSNGSTQKVSLGASKPSRAPQMVCLPPSKPSHLNLLTEAFYGGCGSPSPRALLAEKSPRTSHFRGRGDCCYRNQYRAKGLLLIVAFCLGYKLTGVLRGTDVGREELQDQADLNDVKEEGDTTDDDGSQQRSETTSKAVRE